MEEKGKSVTMFVPRSLYEILEKKAHATGMPVNRFALYCVDNELSRSELIEYSCEMPTNVFVESAYQNEAGKIYRYLEKFGDMGIDELLLWRRDIGIPDKETVLLAIRELLTKTTIIECIYPNWRRYFRFPKSYKVLIAKTTKQRQNVSKKEYYRRKLQELEEGE
jgi:hypothetical protein